MKKWRPKEMFEIENSGGRTNLPQKWIAKKLRAYFHHLWLQSVNLTCTSFPCICIISQHLLYFPENEKIILPPFAWLHRSNLFVFS